MIHIRKVRPKRRRWNPIGQPKEDAIREVMTLCGKWVAQYQAQRKAASCPQCKAIASKG